MEDAPNTAQNAETQAPSQTPGQIPEQHALMIRKLIHDLGNALEIVVQTTYLLGMTELPEPASEWHKMLDGGVTKALEINTRLRAYVRESSPK